VPSDDAGGLGGLGSLVAGWLAQVSKLHICVLGRSAHGVGDSAWLPRRDSPASITAMQCDIGSSADVTALWQTVLLGPVRVLMHAGGALQDSAVAQQSMSSVRHSFAGKLQVRFFRTMILLTLVWNLCCEPS
jgi:saccharopine dehydrogenase-like NADP-dependent oxidoreductase